MALRIPQQVSKFALSGRKFVFTDLDLNSDKNALRVESYDVWPAYSSIGDPASAASVVFDNFYATEKGVLLTYVNNEFYKFGMSQNALQFL